MGLEGNGAASASIEQTLDEGAVDHVERYNQMYSSAMAPSRHFATVTIRPPPSNSPTTQVHPPDPKAIGWDFTWTGVPPVLSTNAFIASMCSWIPRVGGCPFTSTRTSSVWDWVNTPFQSARFHPLKSSSSMP